MSVARVRGGSLIELALITPLLALLTASFLRLGFLFVHQVQLERVAALLARTLACQRSFDSADAVAAEWLIEHHLPDIEPTVAIRVLPTELRPFPSDNTPMRVIAVTLRRSERGAGELTAHAREAAL